MYRLPLFVLPTVLFPGSLLPLHIFEPRYRRMAARCLETDMRFGVLFHDGERLGSFRLREGGIGCEAEILQFQPLQDGRSLVLTRGIHRFRVRDGIESETPYEEAVVEEYADRDDEPDDLADRRRDLIALFRDVLGRRGIVTSGSAIDEQRDVSFQIAQTFQIETRWQQNLLELRSESERIEQIGDVLRSVEPE